MATGVEQAVGRLLGTLCVVTARDGDASSAMLASWISQVCLPFAIAVHAMPCSMSYLVIKS